MDHQDNEEHPKMWINWNSRTFVVTTKKKVNKEKQLENQDEDEDEEDSPESLKPSSSRITLSRDDSTIEDLETDTDSVPVKRVSERRSPRIDEYLHLKDKPSQYCVFPSFQNVNVNDFM